ncbi:alkaline phosphatase family protein [Chloroflexota bacterium]
MKLNKGKRIIVVGLDGATFDLIKPWAKEGRLPTFKKLMKEGTHGTLMSTTPYATIPAWPSFSTGTNPGKHGFYDFFKEKRNSYELTVEVAPSRAVKQETLWHILSNHNKKVAVINVPSTYPPAKVNGYMVTGMLTPPNAKYTYPAELQQELEAEVGKYNVFFSSRSTKDVDSFVNDLEQTLDSRLEVSLYLWEKKHPDFLMMVDNGTDRAEHELWRFVDTTNPLYKRRDIEEYGNPLLRYYQKVDQTLHRFVEILDEDTILVIMSDHGQGSLRKFVNLNIFLMEEGFMAMKKEAMNKLRYFLFNCGFSPHSLYNFLKHLGIERWATDQISHRVKLSLLHKFFFSSSDIDWGKTRAFASGVTGAITINVDGRQPQGNVKFGTEYSHLRSELVDKLYNFTDPETGEKVVSNVYTREHLYTGPYLNAAPDLVATACAGYEFFGMHGFSFSQAIRKTFGNSGSHRPNGIFIAIGQGIKSGYEVKEANILDLAPSILKVIDIPIPNEMDGKVLGQIFV